MLKCDHRIAQLQQATLGGNIVGNVAKWVFIFQRAGIQNETHTCMIGVNRVQEQIIGNCLERIFVVYIAPILEGIFARFQLNHILSIRLVGVSDQHIQSPTNPKFVRQKSRLKRKLFFAQLLNVFGLEGGKVVFGFLAEFDVIVVGENEGISRFVLDVLREQIEEFGVVARHDFIQVKVHNTSPHEIIVVGNACEFLQNHHQSIHSFSQTAICLWRSHPSENQGQASPNFLD